MGNSTPRASDPGRAKRTLIVAKLSHVSGVAQRPLESVDQQGTLDLLGAEASEEIAAALQPLFVEYGVSGEGLFELPASLFHKILASKNLSFDVAVALLKTRYDEQQAAVRSVPETPPDFPPWSLPPASDLLATLLFYHEASRNMPSNGARATRRDWATQPRTVTRWWGAPCIQLPLPCIIAVLRCGHCQTNVHVGHHHVMNRTAPTVPYTLTALSSLFFHSLAVTAAKDAMSRVVQPRSAWTKRCNASSGGLHPVELHLIGQMPGSTTAAVAHYAITTHALEIVRTLLWAPLASALPDASLLAAVNVRPWREVWKYGERGLRYCLLDAGHALGSFTYAAAMLGWSVSALIGPSDNTLALLSGLTRARVDEEEEEIPAMLLLLQHAPSAPSAARSITIDQATAQAISTVEWRGVPSTLSWRRLNWPVVSAAQRASRCTTDAPAIVPATNVTSNKAVEISANAEKVEGAHACAATPSVSVTILPPPKEATPNATNIVRERRSATLFLPGAMKLPVLVSLLESTLRISNRLCTAWPRDFIDLIGVYVINVEGLASGFYLLLRSGSLADARAACTDGADYAWTLVPDVPASVPLYLLRAASKEVVSEAAGAASCKQKIVETSCVTFSMLSPLPALIAQHGPEAYRHAHYEAGMLGQWLYLQEQPKLGATGIGCFVDDLALAHFGFPSNSSHRCMYHFAVGLYVADTRHTPYNYTQPMMQAL